MSWTSSIFAPQITSAANQYGIPPSVLGAQLTQESSLNPNAYNASSGATGIAQFLPSTAANAGYGVQPFDPTNADASINAAAQYDAGLQAANGGNLNAALSAYSGGSYTADSLTNGAYSAGTSGDGIPTMSVTPNDTGDSTNTSDSNPSGTDTSYEAGFGSMSGLPSINNAPVPSDSAGGSGAPTADAGAGMSLLQAALGTTSGASLATLFSDWFTRIVIGILAIGMLIVGFASFKNNSLTITPSGIGSAVRKTIK